ncbi:hypothetical protein ACHAXM_008117 [Skeletonema potamos]|jgi:hypothetical protein
MKLLLIISVALLARAAAIHELGTRQRRHNVPSSIPRKYYDHEIAAFGNPKYYSNSFVRSDKAGTVLKVPKFDVFFDELQKVSPLVKQALHDEKPGGIKAIDDSADVYKWKIMEHNPNRLISHVDKIDNFQDNGVPLIRVRSSLRGPSKMREECFSELISTPELRHKWDATNNIVETIYSAADLGDIKRLQGDEYGEPTMFGVGYVKTKQSIVSPREQMTMCGIQKLPSGASIIWGVELEEDQNHLFPKDQPKRMPRSTSHLFATTLIPTGEDTFDVEYVLQLDVGGFPGWLLGPVVTETVKKMFRFAEKYFESGFEKGGELALKLAAFPDDEETSIHDPPQTEACVLDAKTTLLMPP